MTQEEFGVIDVIDIGTYNRLGPARADAIVREKASDHAESRCMMLSPVRQGSMVTTFYTYRDGGVAPCMFRDADFVVKAYQTVATG